MIGLGEWPDAIDRPICFRGCVKIRRTKLMTKLGRVVALQVFLISAAVAAGST